MLDKTIESIIFINNNNNNNNKKTISPNDTNLMLESLILQSIKYAEQFTSRQSAQVYIYPISQLKHP